MNFIKNLIASIKNFFVAIYTTTRTAVSTVANEGFKAAGIVNVVIALVFWAAFLIAAWYGFVAAHAFLALNTAYGICMYVLIRAATYGIGMVLALHMMDVFNYRTSKAFRQA